MSVHKILNFNQYWPEMIGYVLINMKAGLVICIISTWI